MTRRPNLRSMSCAGAGAAVGLAAFDALAVLARSDEGAGGAALVFVASSALLWPIAVAVGAMTGALLDLAQGGVSILDRWRTLSAAPPGPAAAGIARMAFAALLFLAVHRAVLGLVDPALRSSGSRALEAVLIGLGAALAADLVAGTLVRAPLFQRLRPRTVLAVIGAGLAVLAASLGGSLSDLVEALGLDFFLVPVAAAAGAVAGLVVAGRRRAWLVMAGTAALLVAGVIALAATNVRESLSFDSVVARRLLTLVPTGDAPGGIRPMARPPWFRPQAPAALAKRRPVVLITLDAISANHLGLGGSHRRTSPNLDTWSRRAVVFEAAYAQGPVTRLSMPSLFTSKYPSQVAMTRRTGVTNEERRSDDTLAELVSRAGYETVAVPGGRYFVGFRGMTQGFARVDRTAANLTTRMETRAAVVTERALAEIARLGSAPPGRPTLLWIHYDDAHAPHSAVDGAPAFGRRQIDRYDQEIWWIDRQLGPVLDAIDRELRDREPLVVVTADHGERFDPTGRALDRSQVLLESTLHVPLLVWTPGLAARRVTAPVALLDLVPTILDLCGVRARARFEGRSLVPELLGSRDDPHRTVFADLDQAGLEILDAVAARQGSRLLVVDRRANARRTYDLATDPLAEHPLPRSPRRLVREIEAYTRRMRDEFRARFAPTRTAEVP